MNSNPQQDNPTMEEDVMMKDLATAVPKEKVKKNDLEVSSSHPGKTKIDDIPIASASVHKRRQEIEPGQVGP